MSDSRQICPTCGEKRFVPVEFGECVHCHETTNGLRGLGARSRTKGEGEHGWWKTSPFSGDRLDPFEQ